MTAEPEDPQPQPQPEQDAPAPGANQPPACSLGDEGDLGDCLTDDELSELFRQDWELIAPDLDDPAYADDAEFGPPPEWLAMPAGERARLLAEEDQRFSDEQRAASVPEAFDAGFNRHCGGRPGSGFAAGGPLDELLPGADLAMHVGLARRDLARLDDDQLVGVMIGGQKLEAWAAEVKLAAVAELDARRTARDGEEGQKVSEEIGAALTLTPRSADILAGVAAELVRLPKIQALLANAIIDLPRARVITRYTSPLPGEEAAAVEDLIAQRAGELNTGRLAAACDATVKTVDPDAARRRKEKALGNARVDAWAEPDGTAALAGRDLPPAQVIAADKSLDADAQWLRDHGADGRWDQLRALAYIGRLNRQPLETLLPEPPATPGPAASTSQAAALGGTVNLTMPFLAWEGRADRPGEVAGFGAADADTCRDLAARLQAAGPATRWCVTLVDEHGRAVGHGCARAGPGPPGRSDTRSWLATVAIHTIETSSCAHQRESAGYQPSPRLRHLIKTRSRRCGSPGCGRPAAGCDDDHTLAYHKGGRTCECNLYPLCRRHHRAKQAPGWHLDQPRPGTLIWTLPSGRRYTNTADPYPV
jgi:hypothetical protein